MKRKTGIFALIIGIAFVFAFTACDDGGGGGGGGGNSGNGGNGGNGGTPAHTHQWGKWEQTKTPTMTEAGEDQRVCALDSSHKDTRPIFLNVDLLSAWLSNQPNNTKANPYNIKLIVSNLGGNAYTSKSVGYTLGEGNMSSVYLNLDLSDCNITTIGDNAFTWVRSIVGIILPDNVTSINKDAFLLCGSLTSVTMGSKVALIGERAFSYTGITSITIPKSVTVIESGAFGGLSSYAFGNPSNRELTRVTFEGTIPAQRFADDAFYDFGDLRDKFYATNAVIGTPGTYTTTSPVSSSSVWTRQP